MSRWITIEAAELAVKALEEENARLKAEVERIRKGDERDMTAAYLYAAEQSKDVIGRLKAEVERLTEGKNPPK